MTNLSTLRQQVDAAKITARRNFKRTWGASVPEVLGALRHTIPDSASPADAARKAIARLS